MPLHALQKSVGERIAIYQSLTIIDPTVLLGIPCSYNRCRKSGPSPHLRELRGPCQPVWEENSLWHVVLLVNLYLLPVDGCKWLLSQNTPPDSQWMAENNHDGNMCYARVALSTCFELCTIHSTSKARPFAIFLLAVQIIPIFVCVHQSSSTITNHQFTTIDIH